MNLRRKSFLLIVLTLGGFVVAAFGIVSFALLSGFSALEDAQLRESVQRVQHTIDNELARLESVSHDYGVWDDSVAFIQKQAPDYAAKNLTIDSFRNLNIDTWIYVDARGAVAYSKSVNLKTTEDSSMADRVSAVMTPSSGFVYAREAIDGKSGVLRVGATFMLFAAHPILPSDEIAPNSGTLLLARELNEALLNNLNELTQVKLAIVGVAAEMPKDFSAAWAELRNGSMGPYIAPLDENHSAAYLPLLDQTRKPVALLRIAVERAIYAQTRTAIHWILSALLGLGLLFTMIAVVGLDRLILSRLKRITDEVDHVGERRDFNSRVTVTGHDELASLARTINNFLNTIASQADLEQAVVSARTSAAAKSAFLANMSHELRTPLNAIIGYSELLQESVGDEGLSRLVPDLQKIVDAGKHLQSVISNILDISKIEAGKMELEYAALDIHDAVHAVGDMVIVKAREKGLMLMVALNPGVPRTILGEAGRLRQILVNLLNNALKFTERGEVELTVDAKRVAADSAAAANTWEIHFAVRDTGIGIPEQRFDRLFKAFSQVDVSSSRKYGGTGLGLAISQQLCEMMGGRMWAESTEGVGSTFHFTIHAQDAGT